jgi:enoyl-CoA hydratase
MTLDNLENLLFERDGGIATVTVNRPKVLNALNSKTLDELRRVMLACRRDESVRCLIVTGAGEKSFVAGADINELAVQTPIGGRDHAMSGQHVFDLIENLGKPVIAAINGFALGGGCELAMACTIRIAADTARLGQPEINLGIIPGYAGTQRLARLVGRGRAMEILLTGDHITAAEAHRIGLVNRVVAAGELMNEARKLAAALAGKAPVAARCIIDAVNKGLDMAFPDAQVFEATMFGLVASTEDMREGTRAFLDKRKPEFKGK